MNRATEEKLEKIVEALATAMAPDGALKQQLTELLVWRPEITPKPAPGTGVRASELRDPEVPFFSETYLYALLGKDDARSLLVRMRRICAAAGYDLDALQDRELDRLAAERGKR